MSWVCRKALLWLLKSPLGWPKDMCQLTETVCSRNAVPQWWVHPSLGRRAWIQLSVYWGGGDDRPVGRQVSRPTGTALCHLGQIRNGLPSSLALHCVNFSINFTGADLSNPIEVAIPWQRERWNPLTLRYSKTLCRLQPACLFYSRIGLGCPSLCKDSWTNGRKQAKTFPNSLFSACLCCIPFP